VTKQAQAKPEQGADEVSEPVSPNLHGMRKAVARGSIPLNAGVCVCVCMCVCVRVCVSGCLGVGESEIVRAREKEGMRVYEERRKRAASASAHASSVRMCMLAHAFVLDVRYAYNECASESMTRAEYDSASCTCEIHVPCCPMFWQQTGRKWWRPWLRSKESASSSAGWRERGRGNVIWRTRGSRDEGFKRAGRG